jgi:hypothetical protein
MASVIDQDTKNAAPSGPVVALNRRTIDSVLVTMGAVVVVVLAAAGGLLTWGANFANDHVHTELEAQKIFFPDAKELRTEGRNDLVKYAGKQVDSGTEANAYASFIGGHLKNIGAGKTYAELGPPLFAQQAKVAELEKAKASNLAAEQATLAQMTQQRATVFQGETLRGLLLSTYAWATIGKIASIASLVAFAGAAVMLLLVALGLVHHRRVARS